MGNIALLIIGLILGVACLAASIYFSIKFIKSHRLGGTEPSIDKKTGLTILIPVLLQGVFTILSSIGLVVFNNWNPCPGDYAMLVIGSYLMGSGFASLTISFILYYYRPDLVKNQRKFIRIILFLSIPVFILSVYLLTQGVADSLLYPLANSISFSTGFGFPDGKDYGFTIAFYGIIMVFGAMISYFVCDHYFYKKYKKHGILETLLLVAFPAGLIGGRLWYCFVLEPEVFLNDIGKVFDVRSGGMAIMGGALFGIVFGALFMLRFRKYVNIRYAADIIVPTILIAQFIGRFGNFFNQEVYGGAVAYESISWLPRIIVNNMYINGQYRLPLFLIEGIINIGGYFIIRYAIGKGLRKYLALGDLCFTYVMWYGLTRVLLEPLREGFTLNLGSSEAFGYLQSWITAFVMVAVGILGIVGCHLYDYIRKRKGLEPRTIDTI